MLHAQAQREPSVTGNRAGAQSHPVKTVVSRFRTSVFAGCAKQRDPRPKTLFAQALGQIREPTSFFHVYPIPYIHYSAQLSAAIQPFNFASIQIIFFIPNPLERCLQPPLEDTIFSHPSGSGQVPGPSKAEKE